MSVSTKPVGFTGRIERKIVSWHWLGDVVFLRVRNEKVPGMVTNINIRPGGMVFNVMWATGSESWHYEMELTDSFETDYST